jgi:hypothetical protein
MRGPSLPRSLSPTLTLFALVAPLLASGCLSIPGTEEGGPCNAQKICVEGLTCDVESNTCLVVAPLAWEKMTTPNSTTIHAVWGTGQNNLYAVGANGKVYRFQGSGLDWSEETKAEALTGTSSMEGVWGRNDEVWVVGSSIALYAKGSTWSKQNVADPQTPTKPYTSYTLRAVKGTATGPVWAVGEITYQEDYLFKLKGTDWLRESTSLPYSPMGLAALDQGVFVVGNAQQIKVYSGSAWLTRNLQKQLSLTSVWAAGMDNAWMVGPAATLVHYLGMSTEPTLITVADMPSMHQIAGTAQGDLYLVGDSGSSTYSKTSSIYHCTSGGGCTLSTVSAESQQPRFYGVWCSSDGKTVVVVGDGGNIYRHRE